MADLEISPKLMGTVMGAGAVSSIMSPFLIGYPLDRMSPVKILSTGLLGTSFLTYL